MLQSFHHAPGFHHEPCLAGPSVHPIRSSSWPIATTLQAIFDALREALAARRQYEDLTRRRIPHDAALRQALGISHADQRKKSASQDQGGGNTTAASSPARASADHIITGV
jgi:hypothetical protein